MIDPKRVWFAGELCLGEGNPEQKEKFLFAWEQCVRNTDVVCLIGNMADRDKGPWFERIKGFPGRKILLLGNNEKKKLQWYYSFGFEQVVPFGNALKVRHALGNILITCIPSFESVLAGIENEKYMGLARRFAKMYDNSSCILNIHGYTRGRALPNGKSFDVSLEAVNYCPILLDQVVGVALKGEVLPSLVGEQK